MAAKKTEIQKLKDQLVKAQKAKKTEMAQMVETIKVTHEIAKLDSPFYNKR